MPDNDKSKPPKSQDELPSAEQEADKAPRPTQWEEISPEVLEQLKDLGINLDDPRIRGAVIGIVGSSQYVGIVPSPQLLSDFEAVQPGTADKFFQWAQRQLDHRLELEKRELEYAERRMDRGQKLQAGISVCGLGLAGVAIAFGQMWLAGLIAIIAIGGPAAAVLVAQRMVGKGPEPPRG